MPIKPRTATVPIYDGDDLHRLGELRRAADHAERVVAAQDKARRGAARVGDDDEPSEAAQALTAARNAYDAFVDEASDRATFVDLQALPRRKFRNLMATHPPRKDNDEDAAWGVNMETFGDALLAYVDEESSDVRTVVAPAFQTKADLEAFLDVISDGDFSDLFNVAYELNRAPSSDPKAQRFSVAPPISDVT